MRGYRNDLDIKTDESLWALRQARILQAGPFESKPTNYYKGDPKHSPDGPHYVITTASNWRQLYATRDEAQKWIENYPVSQKYKEEHYSIVSRDEYCNRHK